MFNIYDCVEENEEEKVGKIITVRVWKE